VPYLKTDACSGFWAKQESIERTCGLENYVMYFPFPKYEANM